MEKFRPMIMDGSAMSSIPHTIAKKVKHRPVVVNGAISPIEHLGSGQICYYSIEAGLNKFFISMVWSYSLFHINDYIN
jgi:hypothetical protein